MQIELLALKFFLMELDGARPQSMIFNLILRLCSRNRGGAYSGQSPFSLKLSCEARRAKKGGHSMGTVLVG